MPPDLENLPVGQSLQFYHREDGSWVIVRLVFGPSFLSDIKRYKREGQTLAEAFAAKERVKNA